jgi:uncharacterized coiled-coil DUF342 family protein
MERICELLEQNIHAYDKCLKAMKSIMAVAEKVAKIRDEEREYERRWGELVETTGRRIAEDARQKVTG